MICAEIVTLDVTGAASIEVLNKNLLFTRANLASRSTAASTRAEETERGNHDVIFAQIIYFREACAAGIVEIQVIHSASESIGHSMRGSVNRITYPQSVVMLPEKNL